MQIYCAKSEVLGVSLFNEMKHSSLAFLGPVTVSDLCASNILYISGKSYYLDVFQRVQGYLLRTCCLKTLSCSMIILLTDSLLSCLECSSIGSLKECKSFCPLDFSNNLAIFLKEYLLSISLVMVSFISNKVRRVL